MGSVPSRLVTIDRSFAHLPFFFSLSRKKSMYAVCLIFMLLWIGYAWAWKDMKLSAGGVARIQAEAPTLRQNCSEKKVPCIDDCTFLCNETKTECVGGVCQSQADLPDIPCSEKTGGVRMMVWHPAPHWQCVCTDSRFFRGDECQTTNPDVCEHGIFLYRNRTNYVCICPPPYELIHIDTKPHCVEKKLANFI